MKLRDSLRELLTSRGIGAAAAIAASAQPTLAITLRREEDEGSIALGATKFGGSPDLPRGTEWPRTGGANLRFIAQINLADGAALLPESPLPASGLLSFFWHQGGWGCEAGEGVRVMYTPDIAGLVRVNDPWTLVQRRVGLVARLLGKKAPSRGEGFWPCSAAMSLKVTMPDPSGPRGIKKELLTDDQFDDVFGGGLEKELSGAGVQFLGHRLLGEASPIQGAVEYDAESVSREKAAENGEAVEKAIADWRLLLQVDSDDAAGYVFGDAGLIYFMIRNEDLLARRWDRVCAVHQCC